MQPQPQQQQISMDALHMLYRDLGEARHGVYERNVKLLALQAENERLRAELDALRAEHAPADEPVALRKGG